MGFAADVCFSWALGLLQAAVPVERSSRRRQTYSSNSKGNETEVSSYDEGDDFEESEDEEEVSTGFGAWCMHAQSMHAVCLLRA